ncbi:hypothetical protein ACFZAR_36150 [Streptomyces sp. NPDC008222]|uniref:hypothetical protein n=1 Tax=Streptomyces sp. NPDC008222 TaxID=3364820 RepID=UPI0036E14AC4
MIGAHQTTTWLTRLEATLPEQVTEPAWKEAVLTREAVIGTIRNDLLPHITGGPNYRRTVDDNLNRALAAYRRERGEDTLYWLREAVLAAKAAARRSAA